MVKNTLSFQDEFIEAAGQLAASFSFARSIGQIFALLYISSEPLSLDDICEYLRISKGNGSMNLRNLEHWGAVQKVWIKGSRRVHYSPVRDLKALAVRRVEEGVRRRLIMAKELLAKLEKHSNGEVFSQERLEEIKSLLNTAEKLLNMVPQLQSLLASGLLGSL